MFCQTLQVAREPRRAAAQRNADCRWQHKRATATCAVAQVRHIVGSSAGSVCCAGCVDMPAELSPTAQQSERRQSRCCKAGKHLRGLASEMYDMLRASPVDGLVEGLGSTGCLRVKACSSEGCACCLCCRADLGGDSACGGEPAGAAHIWGMSICKRHLPQCHQGGEITAKFGA